MTDLLTNTGESKLVAACSYPLTGVACVSRVYTDHAVFDVTPDGFAVREAFGDNTVESLAELTGLRLMPAPQEPGTAPRATPAPEASQEPGTARQAPHESPSTPGIPSEGN
jgi:3-oxoadipate CoA-transferase beta subunit